MVVKGDEFMKPEIRKENRLQLLEELYEYYFKNNGNPKAINTKDNFELSHAINYLRLKQWITDDCQYDDHNVTITFDGMDVIESR